MSEKDTPLGEEKYEIPGKGLPSSEVDFYQPTEVNVRGRALVCIPAFNKAGNLPYTLVVGWKRSEIFQEGNRPFVYINRVTRRDEKAMIEEVIKGQIIYYE